jgi:hypothetical protein
VQRTIGSVQSRKNVFRVQRTTLLVDMGLKESKAGERGFEYLLTFIIVSRVCIMHSRIYFQSNAISPKL